MYDKVKKKELEDKELFAKEEKENKKKEREEKKRLAKEENERKKECEEKKARGKYNSDYEKMHFELLRTISRVRSAHLALGSTTHREDPVHMALRYSTSEILIRKFLTGKFRASRGKALVILVIKLFSSKGGDRIAL